MPEWLNRIWAFFAPAWKSLTFLAGVVSVLAAWPKLKALPDAYGSSWSEWIRVLPDRETLAYVFLAIALCWLVWTEIRPNILAYLASTQVRIKVAVLTISANPLDVGPRVRDTTNVENTELDDDLRHITVQFNKPVHASSLTVRARGTDSTSLPVELVSKSRRQAVVLLGVPSIDDILDNEHITIVFEAFDRS